MSSTFRAVRGNRNSQLFFSGLLLSTIGTWVQFTAIAIVVDRLTGKATAIGILTALQFAPMLFFGAWGGAVSDRLDRRKMAIVTQALLAAQAVTIAMLDFAGALTVGAIYVLTLVLGLINALDNPARRGFVTELVAEHQIASAVSLNTAVMTGARIFGPALAALLIDQAGLATKWLFTANALSFVAIIGSLLLLDPSRLFPPPRVARGGTPVRDGLRYVRRTPILWATFIVFTVVSTFGFNYNVVLPRVANEVWGDEAWFGWTLTAISVGSLLGSLATASRERVSLRWMAGMGAILGVAQLGLAWAPSGTLAIVVGPVMGLGAAGFVAAMNSITQQECPPDMRGRILALTAVAFLGSYPIGGPLTGLVADTVGLAWSLAYGAVISLIAVGALVWWALGRHPADSRFEVLRTLLGSSTAVAPSTSERP
ncbi:MAG: MFS transporter [Acidimicrobiaceae bacterium]|nr:MFS transporter [Acidimicrobiaceae bacterium]